MPLEGMVLAISACCARAACGSREEAAAAVQSFKARLRVNVTAVSPVEPRMPAADLDIDRSAGAVRTQNAVYQENI